MMSWVRVVLYAYVRTEHVWGWKRLWIRDHLRSTRVSRFWQSLWTEFSHSSRAMSLPSQIRAVPLDHDSPTNTIVWQESLNSLTYRWHTNTLFPTQIITRTRHAQFVCRNSSRSGRIGTVYLQVSFRVKIWLVWELILDVPPGYLDCVCVGV